MTALVDSDEFVDGRTAMSLVGQPGEAGTRLLAGST